MVRSFKETIMKIALAFLLLSSIATGQQLREAIPHKFLDTGNRVALGALAGAFAADATTTSYALNYSKLREVNPLARPFVSRGTGFQVGYWVASYTGSIGVSYLFHVTGHHRIERIFLICNISLETTAAITNSHTIHVASR